MTEPALTLGIEEEYLLVDPVSRDLVPDPPAELVEALEHRHEGAVAREFFRCQIEVGTPVCRSIAEAQDRADPRCAGRWWRRRSGTAWR